MNGCAFFIKKYDDPLLNICRAGPSAPLFRPLFAEGDVNDIVEAEISPCIREE